MIEDVMSIMEGDEGMDKQKYKELFLFSKGETEKGRDRKYTEILRNLERKRYWGRILKNITHFLLKKI